MDGCGAPVGIAESCSASPRRKAGTSASRRNATFRSGRTALGAVASRVSRWASATTCMASARLPTAYSSSSSSRPPRPAARGRPSGTAWAIVKRWRRVGVSPFVASAALTTISRSEGRASRSSRRGRAPRSAGRAGPRRSTRPARGSLPRGRLRGTPPGARARGGRYSGSERASTVYS